MVEAIKAIRDNWGFANDVWRTPHSKGFAELVGLRTALLTISFAGLTIAALGFRVSAGKGGPKQAV